MAKRIKIPEKFLPALKSVANQADKLPLLWRTIDELDATEITVARINKAFAKKADISYSDAENIVQQIMALHNLREALEKTPALLVDDLTESLERDASEHWKPEQIKKWKDAREQIQDALSPDNPLNIIQKSIRLTYEYENILHDSTIFTDVRPVFGDDAQSINRLIINNVLEIEYSDGNKRRKFFAALDARDIAKLKRACERAQTKTEALKTHLDGLSTPVIVVGAADDE